jgi:hypothetical protein
VVVRTLFKGSAKEAALHHSDAEHLGEHPHD